MITAYIFGKKKKTKQNSSHGRVIAGNSKASVETESVTEYFYKKINIGDGQGRQLRKGQWFRLFSDPMAVYNLYYGCNLKNQLRNVISICGSAKCKIRN